jgi:hypothetical protein
LLTLLPLLLLPLLPLPLLQPMSEVAGRADVGSAKFGSHVIPRDLASLTKGTVGRTRLSSTSLLRDCI